MLLYGVRASRTLPDPLLAADWESYPTYWEWHKSLMQGDRIKATRNVEEAGKTSLKQMKWSPEHGKVANSNIVRSTGLANKKEVARDDKWKPPTVSSGSYQPLRWPLCRGELRSVDTFVSDLSHYRACKSIWRYRSCWGGSDIQGRLGLHLPSTIGSWRRLK